MPIFPDRSVPRVLLVTDSRRLLPGGAPGARIEALAAQVRDAAAAGVDAVLLREPWADGGFLFAAAVALVPLCRLIVGERVDVALAAKAWGVHLRGDGPPPGRVRSLIGQDLSLSRAIHDAGEARQWGAEASLDWLMAGPAFETASKPGKAPLGRDGLRRLVQASGLPILAIGGIDASTAAIARSAGARGVGAIGALLPPIGRDYVDRLRERSLE